MTTFKSAESPYKSNNTASNMAGFTLMNNQVGAVVAQVLAKKDNVKVTYLPSMIRVDGTGMFEVNYDEVSEALGYEPGYFDAAEFEENMSTHYGRMIHQDDRTRHRLAVHTHGIHPLPQGFVVGQHRPAIAVATERLGREEAGGGHVRPVDRVMTGERAAEALR